MADERETSEHDPLDEILAEYMLRVDRGEAVDREQFIAQHPDLADKLHAYFADVEAIDGDMTATATYGGVTLGSSVGPYRLLSMLGEGGLGRFFWRTKRSQSAAGWR